MYFEVKFVYVNIEAFIRKKKKQLLVKNKKKLTLLETTYKTI